MIRAGVLTEDDDVELVDGILLNKISKRPVHAVVAGTGADLLARLVGEGYHVRKEDSLTFEDSQSEPDLAVVRGDRSDYADRHPSADDVLLVVEVSDTTLERDRGIKLDAYAAAGIQDDWNANLIDRVMEVYHHDPVTGRYAQPSYVPADGTVQIDLDGRAMTIALAGVFPG